MSRICLNIAGSRQPLRKGVHVETKTAETERREFQVAGFVSIDRGRAGFTANGDKPDFRRRWSCVHAGFGTDASFDSGDGCATGARGEVRCGDFAWNGARSLRETGGRCTRGASGTVFAGDKGNVHRRRGRLHIFRRSHGRIHTYCKLGPAAQCGGFGHGVRARRSAGS